MLAFKCLSITAMEHVRIKCVMKPCCIPSYVHCCDTVVSFHHSNRQWKSRATTSHTSCKSPESARTTKDCTSAGWHELTTERLWSTKPKPGWRWTPQPGHDDHCRPPRKAPRCTWQTRSRESPARLWARITWVQTRGWPPLPPLTHPPTQLNTTPAQVRPWGRVTEWGHCGTQKKTHVVRVFTTSLKSFSFFLFFFKGCLISEQKCKIVFLGKSGMIELPTDWIQWERNLQCLVALNS